MRYTRTLALWFRICMFGIPVLMLSLIQAIAATQSNILPIFASGTDEFIGLSLVNTSSVRTQVTIAWTDADGVSTRTTSLSLAPGTQTAALVKEFLSLPEEPAQGWIRIDSSESGLLSYMTSGREGVLDGTESASQSSTRIVLPHVAVNTGFMELESTDTLADLINPGSVAANAHVALIGLDGKTLGTIAISIPARASRSLRVSESFHNLLPANSVGGLTFRGYMNVSSDQGLAGWLRIDTPLSRKLLRGRAVEELVPSRLAMVSHFAFGSPALYDSELSFINTGDSTVTLDMVAQDDRGGILGTARRVLSPWQGFREEVLGLFNVAVPTVFPPPMLSGYIRIKASDGGLFQGTGEIEILRVGHAASMLYPIQTAFQTSSTMPFVINDSGYFTGYAVANPNELLTVQTDVSIELLDRDGNIVGKTRNVSLSPSARFVSLIEERISGGYIRIRASSPFALLGSIGTQDGSTLAPLPGLP